jgi:hypothetical protein
MGRMMQKMAVNPYWQSVDTSTLACPYVVDLFIENKFDK